MSISSLRPERSASASSATAACYYGTYPKRVSYIFDAVKPENLSKVLGGVVQLTPLFVMQLSVGHSAVYSVYSLSSNCLF
jgi:hypothetical protein